MQDKLRIVVTGLAATYPFGGVFWDYFQYVLGFKKMGHEVLYLEDTGQWCYDPINRTFNENGEHNAAILAREIKKLDPDLSDKWFYKDSTGKNFGKSWNDVVRFCKNADIFLHISASCWMREEYYAAKRVVFIDSDPLYTQSSIPNYLNGTATSSEKERIELIKRHDCHFTFGENIGQEDCLIPNDLFDWMPTRQPVVMDCFRDKHVPLRERRRVFTTVASWEPKEDGPVIDGKKYTGKSTEFLKYMHVPEENSAEFEIALSGPAPYDTLKSNGWNIVDGYSVSKDPWIYRDYLAHSFAEWSVAKNAYVESNSGWFSCRSACYLALGVPVIVQDTGFQRAIPGGEGVLPFKNWSDCTDAIDDVLRRPEVHSIAARDIAEEYFDSSKVLSSLIENVSKTKTYTKRNV
jgi:hypothetical protein